VKEKEPSSERLQQTYDVSNEDGAIKGFKLLVDGQRAGELVVRLQHREHTMKIQLLMVEPNYRRRGCGARLLGYAEEIACAADVSKVTLVPYSLNEFHMNDRELRRWYARRGYEYSDRAMYRDLGKRSKRDETIVA
jgi:GNAT superfamily N-acetyltransferase